MKSTYTSGNINQLQNINIHTFVQSVYDSAEAQICKLLEYKWNIKHALPRPSLLNQQRYW